MTFVSVRDVLLPSLSGFGGLVSCYISAISPACTVGF